jgi:cell division control protein 7
MGSRILQSNISRGSDKVISLITAFRNEDQIIAVLPYFSHMDFRVFVSSELLLIGTGLLSYTLHKGDSAILSFPLFGIGSCPFTKHYPSGHKTQVGNVKSYFLMSSNFLFDISSRQGVLVDFGLAEVQTILHSSSHE